MAIAIILEDGTRVPGANSYISQADANTYCTNWGYTGFTGASSDAQTSALYFAAYALDRLYGRSYISAPYYGITQGLLWPRYQCVGNDGQAIFGNVIPQCLKDAQCELAQLSIQGISLFPNESDNKLVRGVSTEIGPIKKSTQYWNIPQDSEQYDGFRKVELILFPVIKQNSNDGALFTL